MQHVAHLRSEGATIDVLLAIKPLATLLANVKAQQLVLEPVETADVQFQYSDPALFFPDLANFGRVWVSGTSAAHSFMGEIRALEGEAV